MHAHANVSSPEPDHPVHRVPHDKEYDEYDGQTKYSPLGYAHASMGKANPSKISRPIIFIF